MGQQIINVILQLGMQHIAVFWWQGQHALRHKSRIFLEYAEFLRGLQFLTQLGINARQLVQARLDGRLCPHQLWSLAGYSGAVSGCCQPATRDLFLQPAQWPQVVNTRDFLFGKAERVVDFAYQQGQGQAQRQGEKQKNQQKFARISQPVHQPSRRPEQATVGCKGRFLRYGNGMQCETPEK